MSPASNTLDSLRGLRVVLLGVGRAGRGDDAAGDELARRLQSRGLGGAIPAGSAPENYLGPVLALRPDYVLVADAAEMGKKPGEWSLLPSDALVAGNVSTHNAPLSLVLDYLAKEGGVRCYLLGIQAKDRREGEGLSPEVERTLAILAAELETILERTVAAPVATQCKKDYY
jgi:hydrogenase 3 maturation protease